MREADLLVADDDTGPAADRDAPAALAEPAGGTASIGALSLVNLETSEDTAHEEGV